jgi:osmotically inducible protein OsmC
MAAQERRAEAVWTGNLTEGKGWVSVGSGALGELPVTWESRTEAPHGKTSPEELIAAAHASCFSMALSNNLNKEGHPPERLEVSAVCTADRVDGAWTIVSMDLQVRGRVPGIDPGAFERAAEDAKTGCPVSRALHNNLEIRLKAELLQ